MRAVTWQGVGEIRVETVPDPVIEAPGDALVEVERTAICGSDLHVFHGRETGLDPGTVLGHECVGRIVATGRDVRRMRPGLRVVVPFSTCCGACFFCLRALTARCPQGQLFGWVEGGRGLHGAQAERVRVPLAEASLFEIPESLPAEAALLLADILPTGDYCAHSAGVAPGDLAAVVGCGPVGLMAVASARARGARVLAIDGVQERRAFAARLGAETLTPGAAADAVRDASDGRGADAVLELVGSEDATALAFRLVRAGGTIAAAGVHHEARFPFGPADAYDRNLRYVAGRCPARARMPEVLPLLERVPELAGVFTHRMPLERAPEAWDLFARRAQGCIKVALDPRARD